MVTNGSPEEGMELIETKQEHIKIRSSYVSGFRVE